MFFKLNEKSAILQEENDFFRKKEREQSLALKILKVNFEDLQNNYKMAINSRCTYLIFSFASNDLFV